jgi:hypothetical protein
MYQCTCEKSLFVLSSHQKITLLRTENPGVDTRAEYQKILARNYRYGRKIPAFQSLEGDFFKFPLSGKVKAENPGK